MGPVLVRYLPLWACIGPALFGLFLYYMFIGKCTWTRGLIFSESDQAQEIIGLVIIGGPSWLRQNCLPLLCTCVSPCDSVGQLSAGILTQITWEWLQFGWPSPAINTNCSLSHMSPHLMIPVIETGNTVTPSDTPLSCGSGAVISNTHLQSHTPYGLNPSQVCQHNGLKCEIGIV